MKHIITSLFLTLAIIAGAISITLAFREMYYIDMENMNLAEETGYSEEEIKQNYDALVKYNQDVRQPELELTLPMSEEGRIHFAEVKYIFVAIQYVALPIGLIGAYFMIRAMKKKEDKTYEYLKWTSIFTVALPMVMIGFVFTGWELVFELFHKILFGNEYWVLDPVTDPIINLLPSAFFLHCAVVILLLIFTSGVVCFLLYRSKTKAVTKMKPVVTPGSGATPSFKKKK